MSLTTYAIPSTAKVEEVALCAFVACCRVTFTVTITFQTRYLQCKVDADGLEL
jgi:hypothetical protein